MLGGLGPSQGIIDIECDLMNYCLKKKGKWWANSWFRNKEVNELYTELRKKNVTEVSDILKKNT